MTQKDIIMTLAMILIASGIVLAFVSIFPPLILAGIGFITVLLALFIISGTIQQ